MVESSAYNLFIILFTLFFLSLGERKRDGKKHTKYGMKWKKIKSKQKYFRRSHRLRHHMSINVKELSKRWSTETVNYRIIVIECRQVLIILCFLSYSNNSNRLFH